MSLKLKICIVLTICFVFVQNAAQIQLSSKIQLVSSPVKEFLPQLGRLAQMESDSDESFTGGFTRILASAGKCMQIGRNISRKVLDILNAANRSDLMEMSASLNELFEEYADCKF